jgi:HK97 family phage major capsid protein
MVSAAIRSAISSNERSLATLRMLGIEHRPDAKRDALFRKFNLGQALHDLRGERRTGINAEIHDELCLQQDRTMANSILVPWQYYAQIGAQNRALSVLADGSLVGDQVLPAMDALRPATVSVGLGATVLPLPMRGAGNFRLPLLTGPGTSHWLTSETTQVAESEAPFGHVSFSPKTVGVFSQFSRQLDLQAPSTQQVIGRDHLRTIGNAIDLAALYGPGTGGAPTGIASTSSIGTFSAASCTLSTLVNAQTSLGNGLTASAGVAMTLAAAGSLRQRQEFSGVATTLWQGPLTAGTAAGIPARSSTALTSGDVIVGSWEFLVIPVWGGGVEVALDPYSSFQNGVVGFRSLLTIDVGLVHLGAFTLGSSFS